MNLLRRAVTSFAVRQVAETVISRFSQSSSMATDSSPAVYVGTDPAQRPSGKTLIGRVVSVEPIDLDAHVDGIFEAICGPQHDHLWDYVWSGPYATKNDLRQFFIEQANIGDFVFFCIVDNTTRKPVGLCSYNTVVPQHRSIQVGFLVYAPNFKRSTGATEAMYLMMRHAFEDLGYRRYEWKTNAQNKASRRAALRLGFTYEGTFRNHWIVKGYNRDTAWHSVIDKEWPLRKKAFETWLDPDNFDERGVQKQSLSSLNGVKE